MSDLYRGDTYDTSQDGHDNAPESDTYQTETVREEEVVRDPIDTDPEYYDETDASLAEEEDSDDHESQTRQEAADEDTSWDQQAWDDASDSETAADATPEPTSIDEDSVADDQTRQEAADEDRALDQPDNEPEPNGRDDPSPAPDVEAESSHDEASSEQVTVLDEAGNPVPLTVVRLSPEDRTLGDTDGTGIGRKPTGEELAGMEADDPAESRLDKLLRKATEGGDDLHDAVGNTAESIHDFGLRNPDHGIGHAYEGHPVADAPAPDTPAVSDTIGGAALVTVAIAAGARHWFLRHKGDRR